MEKKEKKKRGPKRKIFLDEEQVKKLARKQWSDKAIAAFFNISEDSLQLYYSDLIDTARHAGKGELHDALWQRALGGRVVRIENGVKTYSFLRSSDKLLEHAINRYIGPVKTIVKIEAKDLPDEELAKIVGERIAKRKETEPNG